MNTIDLTTKCTETIRKVLAETTGQSEHQINKALQDAAPFHKASIDAWRTYGETIYKLTGRQMFGYNYAAIKAKEKRQGT